LNISKPFSDGSLQTHAGPEEGNLDHQARNNQTSGGDVRRLTIGRGDRKIVNRMRFGLLPQAREAIPSDASSLASQNRGCHSVKRTPFRHFAICIGCTVTPIGSRSSRPGSTCARS
jgi:hypothetical protein